MAEQVSSLLRQSLEHLSDEVPESYAIMRERLGPMVVALDVDGDRFSLRGADRLVVSDGVPSASHARIATTRTAILDILDAKLALAEAVEAGAVDVIGTLDDLQRAHDTLLAYVHAAVRAPSQPALLAALRGTPS